MASHPERFVEGRSLCERSLMAGSAKRAPGPRGLPLLGSVVGFYRDPLGFVTKVAEQHGDVALIQMAGLPFYQLSSPKAIHEVLVTKSRDFGKGALGAERRLLFGKGLATNEGDDWRRQRRLTQPAFQKSRILRYGESMSLQLQKGLATWPVGESVDLHPMIMRQALEIVSKVLFGANIGERATEVGERLEILMEFFATQMNFVTRFLPRGMQTPGQKRFRSAVADLDRIVYGIIADRRRSPEPGDDLLSILLGARFDDGSALTDKQLRDEVMTLFLAGHETTSLALSWTFALLGQNPSVEEKLVQEVDQVLGGRASTPADLPRLSYATRVLKESMRLYPPAWILARQAVRDVEIAGVMIPKRAFVTMSQWVMHRDSRYWIEPERFVPDRWTEDFERTLPKFVYFPFGGGQRVCIGSEFAMMEAVLFLTSILQRFRFKPDSDVFPRLDASLSLRPRNGVRGVLTSRC